MQTPPTTNPARSSSEASAPPTQRRPPHWLLGLLAGLSLFFFALAFVGPLLQQTPDLRRALTLASRAAGPGDLIMVQPGQALEARPELRQALLDATAPHSAVLVLPPGQNPPRELSPFAHLYLVTLDPKPALPFETELLSRRRIGEATLLITQPLLPRRPLAQLQDVLPRVRVSTLHGPSEHPCEVKAEAVTCMRAGGLQPLRFNPRCPGLRGSPGVELRTPPGVGLKLALTQPHGLEKIVLQHGPLPELSTKDEPIVMHIDGGAVQRVATLSADAPRIALRPTRDVDLVFQVPPGNPPKGACLQMTWWADHAPSDETWGECAEAGRAATGRGADWRDVLTLYTRGVSHLTCPAY